MSRLLALLALAPLLAGAAETTAPKPPSAFTVEAQRRSKRNCPSPTAPTSSAPTAA